METLKKPRRGPTPSPDGLSQMLTLKVSRQHKDQLSAIRKRHKLASDAQAVRLAIEAEARRCGA